jgi:hypothetical protein
MTDAPSAEHERLAVLVGSWRTGGWTREAPGAPAARIDATDSYEWLPGRFALLHRVDARVGDQKVEGAEIIGYDPARGSYVTQYFGSDGPSESNRFTGTFSADGHTITGHWERLQGLTWLPWMDITLTRQAK